MPRFSLEDLDNLAEYGEKATSIASILGNGAALVLPNPITTGIAVGSNTLGSAIDLYQTGRSLYKGDYEDAAKNVGEAILGLVGAKAIKQGQKLLETDKVLNNTSNTRRFIVTSIGRGKRKRSLILTKEHNDGANKITRGFAYSTEANLSSMLGDISNRQVNIIPSDNTRIVRNYRPTLSIVKGKK